MTGRLIQRIIFGFIVLCLIFAAKGVIANNPTVKATRDKASSSASSTNAGETTGKKYSRAEFKHWSDLNGDGCDAREEIVIRDKAEGTVKGCGVVGGFWVSVYDDMQFKDAGSLDIDHIVPLAEAWRSGADAWSDAKREKFANDPDNLIAVSARSNRSKGDKDPAKWMPPKGAYACEYLSKWQAVKSKYDLSSDKAELKAIADIGC